MNQPKVALFYDWLNQWGGAEKVLLSLIKIYPDAPIFTLVYNPKKTSWLPKNIKINPSILNKFLSNKKNNIFHTPFYAVALEQFDFSQYDIVISTTQVSGHCFITQPKTLYICYLHNVNRYVYQTPPQFKILKPFLNQYKKTDYIYGQRPDYLFCNSKTTQERIQNAYHRTAQVIHPGIDTSFFTLSTKNDDEKYFLVVSRLVRHKKINIAINACHQLGLKLKIVGSGRDKQYLENLITNLNDKNINILSDVSNEKLVSLYQNCQALICPQIEDFGLTPIEAQACGKPVIAYNRGGITETVTSKTGIFFEDQTVESLINALQIFSKLIINSQDCINNSSRFSEKLFMLNFKQSVENLWQLHQKKITTS